MLRSLRGGSSVAGRRGDLFYLILILAVAAAGWVGLRVFGTGPGRPFQDGRLAAIFREIEHPPVDLMQLPFGDFQPSRVHQPLPAQVRYADEMELVLVQNRNALLRTQTPDGD